MITSPSGVSEANLTREMDEIASRLGLGSIEEALRFPRYFQIETTRVCNARCPFCAIDKWDRSVPMMSDRLFDKIAGELALHADWIAFVSLQRAGEPLLDKKLVPRIRRLKQNGIRWVSISTNAALLFEKKATDILEAGVDEIMLSIDSVEAESYRRMRVGLDFDAVMANIERLFGLRDRFRPATVIRVRGVSFHDLDRAEDQEDLRRWEAFWGRLKGPHDRVYMKRAHNWGNQKEWEGMSRHYDEVYHPCVLPWSTLHVTTMGIVPLCPQDYDARANLGDINTQSIAEVWRGAAWERIRRLHRTGERNQIEFCRGCRLFDLEFSLEDKQELSIVIRDGK